MDHNNNIKVILETSINELVSNPPKSSYSIAFKDGMKHAQRLIDEYFEELKEKQNIDHVNHPEHYGGKDNPYEAIKVIEAHNLNFRTGNAVKYILRAGKKGDPAQDIKKAIWYLERELNNLIQVL